MEVKTVAKAVTKAQLNSCLSRIALYFSNTLSKTINFDGVVPNNLNVVKHYGECSTAAGTVGKTVACDGFILVAGAKIAVKFTVTNTADNPTLSVNSTTAKPIYYHGAAIQAGYLAQNHIYEFVYDGTSYELVGDIDTSAGVATPTTDGLMSSIDKGKLNVLVSFFNLKNYSECSTEASTATKTVPCSGYTLTNGSQITVKFDNTNTANNPTLNVNGTGAKSIYYNGALIASDLLISGYYYDFVYNGSYYELTTYFEAVQ
jgi:hypothetical protein